MGGEGQGILWTVARLSQCERIVYGGQAKREGDGKKQGTLDADNLEKQIEGDSAFRPKAGFVKRGKAIEVTD